MIIFRIKYQVSVNINMQQLEKHFISNEGTACFMFREALLCEAK